MVTAKFTCFLASNIPNIDIALSSKENQDDAGSSNSQAKKFNPFLDENEPRNAASRVLYARVFNASLRLCPHK